MAKMIGLPRPHSQGQKDLIMSQTRDIVFAGRRYGKTTAGVYRIAINGLSNQRHLYWWVGLSWRSASMKNAWRQIKELTKISWQAYGYYNYKQFIREVDKEVLLPSNTEIWLRTAERPDSLAGEGVDGVVLDEASLFREKVWTEYIEATLLDKKGWALFICVPKGPNWVAKLWHQAKTREGWRQWHFPTIANPLIDPADVEEIGKITPQRIYQQEYLAQIIDSGGGVFENVNECCTALWQEKPTTLDDIYVFGLDWGKLNDYTVVTVFNASTNECIYYERFNQIDYPTQLNRIKKLYMVFKPRQIVAETNSMGEPLIDQLMNEGLPMHRFTTTAQSKRVIIEQLAVAFKTQSIAIPLDEILVDELNSYSMKISSTGQTQYSAPEGLHDDCVMSLAFGWSAICHDIGISF